ncbi:hypothetical protein AB4Y45_41990 [Paraburkholderia sp. EG287A]|uniref:hypothetical protein n=1 Tax=unclassified Paraburkholderia TaxID=2615204 RepID=UPI0034D36F4C
MAFAPAPSVAGNPVCLTVRCAPGQMSIVGVWQALGQHASHAKRSHVHCSGKCNFDELTVMLDSVSPAELGDVTMLLNAQPWVITALVTA